MQNFISKYCCFILPEEDFMIGNWKLQALFLFFVKRHCLHEIFSLSEIVQEYNTIMQANIGILENNG